MIADDLAALAARSSFTDADALRVVVGQIRAIDRVRDAEENLAAAHTPTARAALQRALEAARARAADVVPEC